MKRMVRRPEDSDPQVEDAAPDNQTAMTDLESRIKQWRESMLASAPAHIRALGLILRRSVRTGSLAGLRRFVRKHGIDVPQSMLRSFRDYLITQRIDLKDLEPAAREALREQTLASEDEAIQTEDYRQGVRDGDDLRCRDCRWFVIAPNDDSPASGQTCVELGTKGADQACFGFTRPPH
jgi:hypothetical protein